MVQSKLHAKAFIALFTLNNTFQKDKIDRYNFPKVRIIDFGISRKLKPGYLAKNQAGTVGYRAPEMLLGQYQPVAINPREPIQIELC